MPAAAVIPAPIAYIKVVAVKTLVVEFWALALPSNLARGIVWSLSSEKLSFLLCKRVCLIRSFTLKKLECSKQVFAIEYTSME